VFKPEASEIVAEVTRIGSRFQISFGLPDRRFLSKSPSISGQHFRAATKSILTYETGSKDKAESGVTSTTLRLRHSDNACLKRGLPLPSPAAPPQRSARTPQSVTRSARQLRRGSLCDRAMRPADPKSRCGRRRSR